MEMRVKALSLLGASLALLAPALLRAGAEDVRLIDAVRNHEPQTVRALLDKKVDPNTRGSDGGTALLWAAHWNDVESADLLIRAGADVNAANDLKVTPLSLACLNGSAPLVQSLLKAGADANLAIATGETPLLTCARSGSVDAVNALLAAGANPNTSEPLGGQTPLMWATAEGHTGVVQALIDKGADPKAHTKNGFTPLHFAAREGHLETAKLLLSKGVDINIRSAKDEPAGEGRGGRGAGAAAGGGLGENSFSQSEGATPLLTAVMHAQTETALFLLEQGANPNDDGAGFTPLHWVSGVWEGEQANPVVGFSDPMSGIPSRADKLTLVKALLAKGADPNARITRNPPGFAGGYRNSKVGATPIFLAAYALDLELIKLLKEAGGDPTIKTRDNVSPLMAAAGVGRRLGYSDAKEPPAIEVATYLMEQGNNAADISGAGENVLHGVAYLGWNTLLQILVDKGAGVNVVSKAGTTPWLAASGQGDRQGGVNYFTETAALLVKNGADPKLGTPCMAQGACRAQ
jgi:ankyrin repeat protein